MTPRLISRRTIDEGSGTLAPLVYSKVSIGGCSSFSRLPNPRLLDLLESLIRSSPRKIQPQFDVGLASQALRSASMSGDANVTGPK